MNLPSNLPGTVMIGSKSPASFRAFVSIGFIITPAPEPFANPLTAGQQDCMSQMTQAVP